MMADSDNPEPKHVTVPEQTGSEPVAPKQNLPGLIAAEPSAPEPLVRPRRHRRVVRRGAETETVSGHSADEGASGWSEPPAAGGDSNDEQLRRDVPPHW